MKNSAVLYASVGPRLTHYSAALHSGELRERTSVDFPARAQCGAFHPSKSFLYIAASDNKPNGSSPRPHTVHSLKIESSNGELLQFGEPLVLPHRPISIAVDPTGHYLLVCFFSPSELTIYSIEQDGSLGGSVPQHGSLEFGTAGHDVVLWGDSSPLVVMVTRGNDGTDSSSEEPGALRQFQLSGGVLSPLPIVAPSGGYGFGPRNVIFHPAGRFIYASLERQNAMQVFSVVQNVVQRKVLFERYTMRPNAPLKPHQYTGAVKIHPAGHALYVANRAAGTVNVGNEHFFNGGDNSIAVYAINQVSGEPTLIQHIDSEVMHARTFTIDQSGTLLIAAGIKTRHVIEKGERFTVNAGLSVFRIQPDGRLVFLHKHEVNVGQDMLFWCDFLPNTKAFLSDS